MNSSHSLTEKATQHHANEQTRPSTIPHPQQGRSFFKALRVLLKELEMM